MNKVTYFIISFFISIITIFATLFANPENFFGWLAIVIFILLAPIVLYRLCKTTPVHKTQKALFIQLIILLVTLIFARVFPPKPDYIVALTESLTKANEIQELLTTTIGPTKIIYENHPKMYIITVDNYSKKQKYKFTHQLLNSDLFDDSVTLNLDVKITINPFEMLKRIKTECENILYGIEDITWLEIKIVPPKNIKDNDAKIKSVTVRYETEENADSSKIREKIEIFINSLFKNSDAEIIIEDLEANSKAYDLILKAQKEFENHNYIKAIDLIIDASKLNKKYSEYIDTIPKIIELDKKIKKGSTNHQNYIEMGDLLSSFVTSLYCNSEAIKNYEKALELNPNAYEVYEKMAHAYTNMMFEYSILADFSTGTKYKDLEQKCREKGLKTIRKHLNTEMEITLFIHH